MSKLKGRKWEQENKRRRCLRRSLVIVWEGCLQQRQQTWTRDRRCITAARRGRWGPAKMGQGDEEGLASVSRRVVFSCREGEGKRCCRPDHSVSPTPVLVPALDTADAELSLWTRVSVCPPACWSGQSGSLVLPPAQIRNHNQDRRSGVGNWKFPQRSGMFLAFCPGGLVYDLLVAPATSSASEQTESNDLPSTGGGGT